MPSGKLATDVDQLSNEAAANFAFQQLKQILPDASPPVSYIHYLSKPHVSPSNIDYTL